MKMEYATKTKWAILVMVILAVFLAMPLQAEDREISGYVTTDMWLLYVDVYKPVALDHTVISGLLTRAQVRALSSQGFYFVYMSDEYDIAIYEPLQIVVYYRNGKTANIICLGDGVK